MFRPEDFPSIFDDAIDVSEFTTEEQVQKYATQLAQKTVRTGRARQKIALEKMAVLAELNVRLIAFGGAAFLPDEVIHLIDKVITHPGEENIDPVKLKKDIEALSRRKVNGT